MRPTIPIFAALLASACGASTPWEPPDQGDLDAALTDCSGGETCVVLQLGCCDHCNGGRAVAVTAGSEAAALAEHGEDCPGVIACTEMGCEPFTAACDGGSCVLVQGSF